MSPELRDQLEMVKKILEARQARERREAERREFREMLERFQREAVARWPEVTFGATMGQEI